MRKYRFADLNTAELIFAYISDNVAGVDFNAVLKLDRVVAAVYRLYDKAVLVFVEISGIVIEIISPIDDSGLLRMPVLPLKSKFSVAVGALKDLCFRGRHIPRLPCCRIPKCL